MALTNYQAFGTSIGGADDVEGNRLTSLVARGWVISSPTLGANATQVSNAAYGVLVNGKLQSIAASGGTALWVTGIGTLATGTTGAFVVTVTVSGTHKGYVCAGTTLAAIAFPVQAAVGVTTPSTIAATEVPLGIIVVACTAATGFNGGTNSLADTSYTVSAFSFTGPSAIALSTENFTTVPG